MSRKPSIQDRSVGGRRRTAMAADAADAAPSPATKGGDLEEAAAPQAAPAPSEKPAKPKTKAAPRTLSASDTARLGIYITPAEYDAAKSAYLADWQHGGQSDTFGKWISAALETHAARDTDERTRLARHGGRSETRTGATRSFNIPTDTVERMRAAITDDQAAGRWPSDSAWCGDAIAAAVDLARQQAGGVLPQPPARLPNRLRR